jgi:hypothetical protein
LTRFGRLERSPAVRARDWSDGELQYQVKSTRELHERAAKESELKKAG